MCVLGTAKFMIDKLTFYVKQLVWRVGFVSGVLKWRHLITGNDIMRWALGASEICFKNNFYAKFFGYGRVVPVVRGDGVYQPSIDFILKKLNKGGWVHVFPEGIYWQ